VEIVEIVEIKFTSECCRPTTWSTSPVQIEVMETVLNQKSLHLAFSWYLSRILSNVANFWQEHATET